MDPLGSNLRGVTRRDSEAEVRVKPGSLQRATRDDQRNIISFLTLREAVRLMLTSADMQGLIHADPWFRQDDLYRSLDKMGLGGLARTMQSLESELSGLHPDEAVPMQLTAGCCCGLLLARTAARAAQSAEQTRLAEVRGVEGQMAQVEARLQAFEPQIEQVVFHHVSERLHRPGLGLDKAALSAAITVPDRARAAGRGQASSALAAGIKSGDAAQVRLAVRKFLGLPAAWMSSARKLDRLMQHLSGPLDDLAQAGCGTMSYEMRQYGVIMAAVDEIVSAGVFSGPEEMVLASKLADICRSAMGGYYKNPALVASILLGVHASTGRPELKHSCLAAIGEPWHGGLPGFVDFASGELLRWRSEALEWADGVVEQLEALKP
ncbi:MAG: hypothetical protein H7332_15930 [Bdellovibrionales bacterium]|nr:hypothetical protein [Ramlibacter sp.]